MRRAHRFGLRTLVAPLALVVLAAVLVGGAPPARAVGYPVAPLGLDRYLLSNLSAPSLAPGGSGEIAYRVADPSWWGALSAVSLTLDLYALNGYPGDAVGPLPVADAPILEASAASGTNLTLPIPDLAAGGAYAGSVSVVTGGSTPAGTYAVRTQLTFEENSSTFLFRSRGWFTAAAWAAATAAPGGNGAINATRLGVSGVVPETAIEVAPSGWAWAIGGLLAVGFTLVGLGAWLYYRRGPGSRSGTGKDEADGATNAPRAFGSRRSSPGDSRSN